MSTETESPQAPDTEAPAKRRQRIVFFSFGGILLLGLLMTSTYFGGRIVEAKGSGRIESARIEPARPVAAAAVFAPRPAPAAKPVAKPAPFQAPVKIPKPNPVPVKLTPVTPRVGERYLQVAALGPSYTGRFVQELRGRGLRPVVAPGPEASLFRVLVGPFVARAELLHAKEGLEKSGLEVLERRY